MDNKDHDKVLCNINNVFPIISRERTVKILDLIYHEGRIPKRYILRYLKSIYGVSISEGWLIKLMHYLEEKGYVVKDNSLLYSLTDKGKYLVECIHKLANIHGHERGRDDNIRF